MILYLFTFLALVAALITAYVIGWRSRARYTRELEREQNKNYLRRQGLDEFTDQQHALADEADMRGIR